MRQIKQIAAVVLTLCFVLSCLMGISANSAEVSQVVKIQCEGKNYTAAHADGSAWVPKSESANMTAVGGSSTKGIVFTDGTVGGRIGYKITAPVAERYELSFAFRPNENYHATVQTYLDGKAVGTPISMRSTVSVGGAVNIDNKVRSISLGSVELTAGEHTVEFLVLESEVAPKSITVALDYISIAVKDDLLFQSESTPFVATDSDGNVIKTSDERGTWAWNTNFAASNASGCLAYFRDGGFGGTIDYILDIKDAGEYSVTWAFRPSGHSYSVTQVYVNGEKLGDVISHCDRHMVGGVWNTTDVVRTVVLGNADFDKGENTIRIELVSAEGASNPAFASDYFKLCDPVDESTLVFTDFEAERPKPNSKENSTPVTVTVPEGMLDTYEGKKEAPKTTDKITVYPRASCYTPSALFSIKVDGVSVPVTSVGGDYEYANFDYDPTKGEIEIEITYKDSITSTVASPQHIIEKCTVSGKTAKTVIKENYIYNFCINGKNLVVGADPMQSDVPESQGEGIFNVTKAPYSVTSQMSDKERTDAFQRALDDASAYGSIKGNKNGVVYVPAGVYYVGNLRIGSNTYFYLEGGAVLRIAQDYSILSVDGCKTSLSNPDGTKGLDYTWWISTKFQENGTEVTGSYDIHIGGRGTVDSRGKDFWNSASLGSNTVIPIAASYFTCDGITIREAGCWSVIGVRSDHVQFSWLKIFQRMNMGEDDALDICECQHVVVTHCAGYSLDDSFSAKTWPKKVGITMNWPGEPEYNDDILFEHNIAYTRCFGYKLGQGTDQCHYDVVFRDNTVVLADVGIGMHCYSGSGTAYNTVFENCYIEKFAHNQPVRYFGWLAIINEHNGRGDGYIKGVTVKNIYVYKGAEGTEPIEIFGIDAEHTVDGVTFSNIYFDGEMAEALDDIKPSLSINDYAHNIKMENTDGDDKPNGGNTDGDDTNNGSTENNNGSTENNNGNTENNNGNADGNKDKDNKKSDNGVITAIVVIVLLTIAAAVVIIMIVINKKRKL